MKGVKAVDDKDKDVSDSLIIESMKMGKTEKPHSCMLHLINLIM